MPHTGEPEEPLAGGPLKELATALGQVVGHVEGTVEVIKEPYSEPQPRHADVQFEDSDINPRGTFLAGVGVLAGIWISIGVLVLFFLFLRHQRAEVSPPPLPIVEHGNPVPPEPRLQAAPRQDLKAMQAREDWELNHYHWINKGAGIIAIPVTEAMQLIAQRGLPPQNTPPNPTLTPPQAGTRTTGFEGKVEPEPR